MTNLSRYWPVEPYKRTLLIISAFLLLMSIFKAGYYTLHYGGTDLRSISISAKLLGTENDPYFYRWSTGEPEHLINPNLSTSLYTNGVTVAPGTLYFLSLFNSISYPALRIFWTALQYCFALYIFGVFLFQKPMTAERSFALVVTGVLFFFCSPVWFLNIERGQVYILFAFLFTVIFQLYQTRKPWLQFAAGLLIAAAAYARPNFLVLLLPLMIARSWHAVAGCLSACLLLGLHAYNNPTLWQGYSAVVNEFSAVAGARPPANHVEQIFPATIEGLTNLTSYKDDFVCGGISSISVLVNKIAGPQSFGFYAGILLIAVLALTIFYRRVLMKADATTLFLFGFLLFEATEYLAPAPRSAYNLIIWIFPVMLMLQRGLISMRGMVLLITGLCFVNGFPFYFPGVHDLGEGMMVVVVMGRLRKLDGK